MHGTSSRPSKCAASTRQWPAIMPSSSSISTGLVKPNSRIEAAICATCWVVSANFWLEFPGFQDPKSPFHDKRVRQAISLAVDRRAINDAESGGLGKVDGNWINDDVQYAIDWPEFEHNVAKAKQLMAEAGFPNGFKVDWVTPTPAYYSR